MSAHGITQRDVQNRKTERRRFPRIQASCPVRYLGPVGSDWISAELYDYSAIGVRIVSDSTLFQNSKIKLVLMPDSKSRVPSISAEAIVLRCNVRNDHRYEIACKLTKVQYRRNNTDIWCAPSAAK